MKKIYLSSTNSTPHKNLLQHLVSVYGIGRGKALRVCDDLGLCPCNLYANYTALLQDRIDFYIQEHFFTGTEYKNIIQKDISRFVEISCYKGIRHSRGLPCRGQRTHGNAKTARKSIASYKKAK